MIHENTLVKATINSASLQTIAGLFLMTTKGKGADLSSIDSEELDYLRSVAKNVATQVMHQCKAQNAPVDLLDETDLGIDMEFEAPVFVVAMICRILKEAFDILGNRDVGPLVRAWVPMAKASIRVQLDVNGERELFNNSWEASEG